MYACMCVLQCYSSVLPCPSFSPLIFMLFTMGMNNIFLQEVSLTLAVVLLLSVLDMFDKSSVAVSLAHFWSALLIFFGGRGGGRYVMSTLFLLCFFFFLFFFVFFSQIFTSTRIF